MSNRTNKQTKKTLKKQAQDVLHENIESHDNVMYCTLEKKATITNEKCKENEGSGTKLNDECRLQLHVKIDVVSVILLFVSAATRFYKLNEPSSIVFDELHYGKYVSLYMKNTFFFDADPPLGKQLIALAAYFANYNGKFKFDKIGREYNESVPLFALRFIPALCGTLIIPLSYHVMLHLGCSQFTATLAAFLLLCDNGLLTQSRFMLMEPMLILFSLFGLYCILRYRDKSITDLHKWVWLVIGYISLALAITVKYSGIYAWFLATFVVLRDLWCNVLPDKSLSNFAVFIYSLGQCILIFFTTIFIYLTVFYLHLTVLYKAGPHDNVMTSAFQASLEGGLASITKGQPLDVAHGSQITLRHTHGRTCWLHSHGHVYPIRYSDGRGSSHQQQVTCYTFKDVNNWWIVKRPEKNNLNVGNAVDVIKHGDVIQLVHGITSRALNTHDVAAPMTPHNQEVSCYIDYNVSMAAQNLWKVDIVNKEQTGDSWHTIQSMVRLIHVPSNQALRFSGRQLPDWGFYQYEVVADKLVNQQDSIWNVEEHRYTTTDDEKERERDMMKAELIPMRATMLTFWDKLFELQYKMFFNSQSMQNHMYNSEPYEWPLLNRGVAYWVSSKHNGQIHLLGNVVVWYSAVVALLSYVLLSLFYLIRRRRLCFDIPDDVWNQFIRWGEVLFVGYLLHYLPYFFVDRSLFLHHYLPAVVFKILLTAAVAQHIGFLLRKFRIAQIFYCVVMFAWILFVFQGFVTLSVISYGIKPLSAVDVVNLHWKETWDLIVHTK